MNNRRRVLMLIENVTFAWDRRMRHMAAALVGAGYDVSVICPGGKDEDRSACGIVQGVHVYHYPMLCQARGGMGYVFEYGWALLCTTVLSLFVWCRRGIDIIHSANPPDIFFILARFYRLFGKKYVYDEHDVCPELYELKFGKAGWMYKLLVFLERQSFLAADLVISTNESYREVARQRGGVSDERSVVVRNGVDIRKFHKLAPRSELREGFRYMAAYLGVMGPQDGVDRVVRAAHHLVYTQGRRDVLFVIIGTGVCWHELQDLSRDLKVEEVIRFPGRVSDELLLDYLSTADVCLAPDPPEPMNQMSTMTKIMEYMACERPIVSYDLLETRRSAEEAAVYVSEDDPAAFAIALTELLDDILRREKMGQIGLERTINNVGLDRSRKALLEGYARLL